MCKGWDPVAFLCASRPLRSTAKGPQLRTLEGPHLQVPEHVIEPLHHMPQAITSSFAP